LTRHELSNPSDLPPPSGFSYAAKHGSGRMVHLAGLTGHHADGSIDDDLVDQFRAACQSVARVIAESGGEPDDLVSMTIFTVDVGGYRDRLGELGVAYRSVFGRHYPPMSLLGIEELFDPAALVELVCVAVVPD
jgi:enamine deaminase RidA (YjgF/YER057c/UK114 family)